jgi:hypothetical protein
MKRQRFFPQGQAAVEYMLLMAMALVVVLLGFKTFFPRAQDSTNKLFDKQSFGIMGKPPNIRLD